MSLCVPRVPLCEKDSPDLSLSLASRCGSWLSTATLRLISFFLPFLRGIKYHLSSDLATVFWILFWVLLSWHNRTARLLMDPAGPKPKIQAIQRALAMQGNLLGQHSQADASGPESSFGGSDVLANGSVGFFSPHPLFQLLCQGTPEPLQQLPPPRGSPFQVSSASVLQCTMMFCQKPITFSREVSKICYMLGLLRGRALTWAEALHANTLTHEITFKEFISRFRAILDHPNHAGNNSGRLLSLRQGTRCFFLDPGC